jgi:trehalose 6-phosphate phosphatase
VTVPPPLRPVLERPGRSVVLLDFDGSISAIVDDPADAAVLPAARAALAALVERLALVGVVSGRPVEVLARAIDVDGLVLVGQYGLERLDGGRVVVDPRVEPHVAAVAAAAAEAEGALPGLLVERKGGVAVTVHWRTTPERDAEAIATVDRIARRHGLTVYATRMARELRPPVPADKGTAVEELLAHRFHAAVFAGDDRGDLPAFDALDRLEAGGRLGHAIRIGVSSDEAPPELVARADVLVAGPDALAGMLGELGRAVRSGVG